MPRRGHAKLFRFSFFQSAQGKPDYFFVGAFFLLLVIGIVILSSASAVVSYQKFGTHYYYVIHQILFGLLPGLILFAVTSRIDYHVWQKFSVLFLGISVVLLMLVFLPGVGFEYGGAHRWIRVGSLLFQPSEIVKLTFLLYLASWLSSKGKKHVQDFSYGFLPFIILTGVIAFLIIAQPDVGTMAVIALIAFAMYFVGGAALPHIAIAGAAALALFFVLINTASYRLKRFMTFLRPELDPLGVGYHINQALLAIGSGGLFGRGFGHSRQKFAYLPEVTGDSIFAIAAEELGFFFSMFLLGLYVFLAQRGLRIARNAPDDFGKFVAIGITAWIIFQAFINIGAMLSLLPLTGIPLPFISYGGSALLVSLAGVGILVNISRQSRES
ncbi:putative lipid II flippase FtsW [Candidatus Uhrbacteria bacterium]|nr:putative lipid II flippase FtsW [Candidatus Uhrbacteria bacterium]